MIHGGVRAPASRLNLLRSRRLTSHGAASHQPGETQAAFEHGMENSAGEILGAPFWFWAVFAGVILAVLVFDLGYLSRRVRVLSLDPVDRADGCLWRSPSLFGVGVWAYFGAEKGSLFFTAYVVEQSLSIDNVFVMSVIFSFFAVPRDEQHRVLFWGIVAAMVLRAVFVALRGGDGRALRLAALSLRHVPHRHRRAHGVRGRSASPTSRRNARRAMDDPPAARHQRPRARAFLPGAPGGRDRQARDPRDAAVPRLHGDQCRRHRLRGRQRAGGSVDDAGPVHRLHLQHLRDPRACARFISSSMR